MPLPMFTAVYRLTNPPKLQVVKLSAGQKNVPVLHLRLAASANRYDRTGDAWSTTGRLFIDAELFDRNAAELAQVLEQGTLVTVTGELITDEWLNSASQKRSKIKIKAHSIYPMIAASRQVDQATK